MTRSAARLQLAPPPARKPSRSVERTPLPEEFTLTPDLERWALGAGVGQVRARFDHFIDAAAARGYVYADWPAAFRNACRSDWAGLGAPRLVLRCADCSGVITGGHVRRDRGPVCLGCDA